MNPFSSQRQAQRDKPMEVKWRPQEEQTKDFTELCQTEMSKTCSLAKPLETSRVVEGVAQVE